MPTSTRRDVRERDVRRDIPVMYVEEGSEDEGHRDVLTKCVARSRAG
jgi:hypothetical protein